MCGEENKCPHCGSCGEEKKPEEEVKEKKQKQGGHDDTHLAILLALVPAMTMSLFNLMGLM